MKKLFIAVISMAALASCTQEDIVINNANNAIAFDNAFVSTTTKAIDPSITTDNIVKEKFYVWGTTQGDHAVDAPIVPIFTKEEVAFKNGGWNYASEHTQYWIAGNKYNFAAVVNGTVETLENGLPKTITYTADGETDLLYARSTENIVAKATNNGKVGFTFAHLLSKAVFTFTNTSENNTSNLYVVENIQISGLAKSATFTVGSGWGSHVAATTPVIFGNIVETATDEGANATPVAATPLQSNYERLLIPGSYNVTIKCTVKLYLNGDAKAENLAHVTNYSKTLDLELAQRTSYNFAISAGLNDAIEFKVNKVNDWN